MVESSKWRMERKILPLNIDDKIGVSGGGRNVNDRGGDLKKGRGYENHSKERVTMSLAEKLETMGTGTELDGSGGVDEVNERLVETVVSSLTLGVIKEQTLSETPVKIISPDVRARRDRDKDRRGKVERFRHTLAGGFLQWCKTTEWVMRRPEDSGLTCC